MKLEQSFEVDAPLEKVWAALIDVEHVAPCLPGAEITEHADDGSYKGTFTVKLGPTTAHYAGTLRFENVDEANHTATIHARGTDKRGQGGATATIVNTVRSVEGRTHVDAVTDFTITGKLARFGRGGMIEDISNRMLADFAKCLQARLRVEDEAKAHGEEPPAMQAAEPPHAIALFFSVLWQRIKRVFSRSKS
jgi:uncharacterized protein